MVIDTVPDSWHSNVRLGVLRAGVGSLSFSYCRTVALRCRREMRPVVPVKLRLPAMIWWRTGSHGASRRAAAPSNCRATIVCVKS